LDGIAGSESGGIPADGIDEGAMATAEVFDDEAFFVLMDDGVLPGDLRVRQGEIAICLSADGEGQRLDRYGVGVVTVLNEEAGWMFFVLHKGSLRQGIFIAEMTTSAGPEWVEV
jgi:hypothetical protein